MIRLLKIVKQVITLTSFLLIFSLNAQSPQRSLKENKTISKIKCEKLFHHLQEKSGWVLTKGSCDNNGCFCGYFFHHKYTRSKSVKSCADFMSTYNSVYYEYPDWRGKELNERITNLYIENRNSCPGGGPNRSAPGAKRLRKIKKIVYFHDLSSRMQKEQEEKISKFMNNEKVDSKRKKQPCAWWIQEKHTPSVVKGNTCYKRKMATGNAFPLIFTHGEVSKEECAKLCRFEENYDASKVKKILKWFGDSFSCRDNHMYGVEAKCYSGKTPIDTRSMDLYNCETRKYEKSLTHQCEIEAK